MLHANTCLQVVLEINFRQCLCDIVKSTMAFKPLKKTQQNIFLWMSSLWFVYRLPVYRVIQSVTYISQKWKLIYQICSRHDIAEILLKLTLNPKSINFTINIQSLKASLTCSNITIAGWKDITINTLIWNWNIYIASSSNELHVFDDKIPFYSIEYDSSHLPLRLCLLSNDILSYFFS